MDVNDIRLEALTALSEARAVALATRKTVLEYSEGYLVRVSAEGTVEKVLEMRTRITVESRRWRIS